jgi:hypothetical protein
MMGSSLLRLVMTRKGGSFIDAGAQISSDTIMLALVSSTMLTLHATCYNNIKKVYIYMNWFRAVHRMKSDYSPYTASTGCS